MNLFTKMDKQFTIKTKVIILLVSSLVILTLFVAGLSIYKARDASLSLTYDKLSTVRDIKKSQIESFIFERIGDIKVLSSVSDIHLLIEELNLVTKKLNLNKEDNLPVNNSDIKDILDRYEPFFQSYIKNYGYYDIFLINPNSGQIVYSAAKESDFGMNLLTSELKESGLAKAFKQALERKKPSFVDMEPYSPSNDAPAMFLSTPIFSNNNEIEMVLALQISDVAINKIMKFRKGAKESEESYLVGGDYLMRSDSFLAPETHSLRASFSNPNKGSVKTDAVREALLGKSNTKIILDYNGNHVLSSYTPIKIDDNINWALISEIDKNEVMSVPNELAYTIISLAIIIMIIIAIVSIFLLSIALTNPLRIFQGGVLEFFKYLNKETTEVTLLNNDHKDELGKMAAVIDKNIVKTKELIEEDEKLIVNVKNVVSKVKEGYLTFKVEKDTTNERLQELKSILNEMLEILSEVIDSDINEIIKVLDRYKVLDFRAKIENPTGNISKELNELTTIISNMLYRNMEIGVTLRKNAEVLTHNVQILSTSSNQQAASLEETAAALEEITATIVQNSDHVVNMHNNAKTLSLSVKEGEKLASSTANSMDEINEQTQAIADAITVIDQIAFQTNILSLNAAVEAATAGEAGKGFAIVAQEVRSLASRSAEAASEIKELVENATEKTKSGKINADKMIHGYEDLNEHIINTVELIEEVSSASKEQKEGIKQINDAVTELDRATQENAIVATQTSDIAKKTNDIAISIVKNAEEKEFEGQEKFNKEII